MYPPITLFEHQKAHVQNMRATLLASPFMFDVSPLGSGKTYTASKLAEMDYKSLLVVCPVSMKGKWTSIAKHHGIPLYAALSYQELRSRRGIQVPKHGLLARDDEIVNESKRTTFTATPSLRSLAACGLLVVFDEVQAIKNTSEQALACASLVRAVVDARHGGALSSVILMSGSPIDKEEQVPNILRVLGVLTQSLVTYDVYTRKFSYGGLEQVLAWCNAIQGDHPVQDAETLHLLRAAGYGHLSVVIARIYELFQRVIIPRLASAMPLYTSPSDTVILTKQNAFYDVGQHVATLSRAVSQLGRAVRYDRAADTVDFTGNGGSGGGNTGSQLALLTASLMGIEFAKLPVFVRIARDALEKNPSCKVVLAMNYLKSIDSLAEDLKAYDPLVMTGRSSVPQRQHTIALFQSQDCARRLLIANAKVICSGLDLDDKSGHMPRIVFVSPNYHTIDAFQLGFRFKRMDTKSSATVNFVYGAQEGCTELQILNALAKKSSIMKRTVETQNNASITFPCDHTTWIEPTPM